MYIFAIDRDIAIEKLLLRYHIDVRFTAAMLHCANSAQAQWRSEGGSGGGNFPRAPI